MEQLTFSRVIELLHNDWIQVIDAQTNQAVSIRKCGDPEGRRFKLYKHSEKLGELRCQSGCWSLESAKWRNDFNAMINSLK